MSIRPGGARVVALDAVVLVRDGMAASPQLEAPALGKGIALDAAGGRDLMMTERAADDDG